MPWVKIDDGFTDHPKIESLTDPAFRLHVAGLCFCGRMLSDGFIPADRVNRLLPKVKRAWVNELINGRLWAPVEGGYTVLGYLDYNPSKAKVEKDRADAAERKRKFLERKNAVPNGAANGVQNGGGNASPTQPDPTRPVGPGVGSTGSPLALVSSPAPSGGDDKPDTSLPTEVVERNTEQARAARKALRGIK